MFLNSHLHPPPIISFFLVYTIILPVVLYGCKTWPLALREEQRLRVFENMVLRMILWCERNEVTGK
jgi:hypothetical protein